MQKKNAYNVNRQELTKLNEHWIKFHYLHIPIMFNVEFIKYCDILAISQIMTQCNSVRICDNHRIFQQL